jgi:hypothetical protein
VLETTTGTMRNGNIFLSRSDGSTTTGSYNKSGSTTTTVSPPFLRYLWRHYTKVKNHTLVRREIGSDRITYFWKSMVLKATKPA